MHWVLLAFTVLVMLYVMAIPFVERLERDLPNWPPLDLLQEDEHTLRSAGPDGAFDTYDDVLYRRERR